MKSVDFKYIHNVDVDAEFRQFLRENGVDTDDFDYVLITEADILEEREAETDNPDYFSWLRASDRYEEAPPKTIIEKYFIPKDYFIERMLRGSWENVWHKLTIDGKVMAVGIAYH